jgi:hypothetical protein
MEFKTAASNIGHDAKLDFTVKHIDLLQSHEALKHSSWHFRSPIMYSWARGAQTFLSQGWATSRPAFRNRSLQSPSSLGWAKTVTSIFTARSSQHEDLTNCSHESCKMDCKDHLLSQKRRRHSRDSLLPKRRDQPRLQNSIHLHPLQQRCSTPPRNAGNGFG